jgi:hypothetical protein
MSTDLNETGFALDTVIVTSAFCLDDFEVYNNNKENITEIKYLEAAFFISSASDSLRGENFRLKLYQSDGITLLFEYVLPDFVAANYIGTPLKIILSQQEVDNVNRYLANHLVNNCFVIKFILEDAQPSNKNFQLRSRVEFLAEMKSKLL